MGRNAAFGRPPASERFRTWWDARSNTSRQNIYLAIVVGVLSVAIVMAATARDQSRGARRVIASRSQPTTTFGLPTPSTVNVGNLGAGGTVATTDLSGLSSTTTTPAPATTAVPPARSAPTVATTAAPSPPTTVANPDIVFSTVPPETTTTTQPPVTTTRPSTTTTAPPTTTTTRPAQPLGVPAL